MAEGAPRLRGWSLPWIYPTGLFIRDYLLKHKTAYPQEIWKALKAARKSVSEELGESTSRYENFWRNYIYVLKKLGLIEPVRRVANPKQPMWFPRTYYRIVPGRENDPRWVHPQIALDPRRGKSEYRRRYAKAKKVKIPLPPPLTPEEIDRIWAAAEAFLRERRYILTREQFEAVKPEWPSEAGLYPTFEERVGYVIRYASAIYYVSRMARRLISVEEAPEPIASEALRLGKTLEREWLRRR